jgi:hypothetical protein
MWILRDTLEEHLKDVEMVLDVDFFYVPDRLDVAMVLDLDSLNMHLKRTYSENKRYF